MVRITTKASRVLPIAGRAHAGRRPTVSVQAPMKRAVKIEGIDANITIPKWM